MLCVVCIQTSNNTQPTSDRITSFAHERFTGVPHFDPLPLFFSERERGGGGGGIRKGKTITSLTKYLVRLSTRRLAETLRVRLLWDYFPQDVLRGDLPERTGESHPKKKVTQNGRHMLGVFVYITQ